MLPFPQARAVQEAPSRHPDSLCAWLAEGTPYLTLDFRYVGYEPGELGRVAQPKGCATGGYRQNGNRDGAAGFLLLGLMNRIQDALEARLVTASRLFGNGTQFDHDFVVHDVLLCALMVETPHQRGINERRATARS